MAIPLTDNWSVNIVLESQFVQTLSEPSRSTLLEKFPALLHGKEAWQGPVSPEEVQLLVNALTAPLEGKPQGWTLTLHLLQMDLFRGRQLLFSSQEFGQVIEVYPDGDLEAMLLAELEQLGFPSERIYPDQGPVFR